jgi:GTP-binding protein HflX
VEIARLEYLRPRIRGVGIDMDQQAGGIGGSRGPGETASELLARKLDHRLEALKKAARRMSSGRNMQRRRRENSSRIVLVGYTNAGKTSIMNALTQESLSARDMPFETLDTTSRALARHGGDVIVSDTVGFIRRLPESLLASFESTLSEIREASLLVIVVDVSDYEWRRHVEITLEVLDKLGAAAVPRFYLFNKADLLGTTPENGWLDSVAGTHPYVVMSSGDEGAIQRLKATLLDIVRGRHETVELFVPYSESKVLGELYGTCRVLATEAFESGMKLRIHGKAASIRRLTSMLEEIAI